MLNFAACESCVSVYNKYQRKGRRAWFRENLDSQHMCCHLSVLARGSLEWSLVFTWLHWEEQLEGTCRRMPCPPGTVCAAEQGRGDLPSLPPSFRFLCWVALSADLGWGHRVPAAPPPSLLEGRGAGGERSRGRTSPFPVGRRGGESTEHRTSSLLEVSAGQPVAAHRTRVPLRA